MNEYYGNNDWRSYKYLQHHGILGQKWGKRNGPPYPLGSGDHSSSEKKAGWRKSLKSSGEKRVYRKRVLTDGQKKALKIGALAAAAAVAAVGTAYLIKSGRIADLRQNGKTAVTELTSIAAGGIKNVDNATGFPKLTEKIDALKASSTSNPHYGPNNPFDTRYKMNCGNCVIAWDARLRGLDVQARANITGMTFSSMASHYKGIHSNTFKDFNFSNIKSLNVQATPQEIRSRGREVLNAYKTNIAKEMPNGSRGNLMLPTVQGSHWMAWAKDSDGKVTIFNPQYEKIRKTDIETYAGYFTQSRNKISMGPFVMRTDDLSLNTDNIKEAIQAHGIRSEDSYYDTYKVANNSFVSIHPEIKRMYDQAFDKNEVREAQVELMKQFGKKKGL